jgi:hypothetical protein
MSTTPAPSSTVDPAKLLQLKITGVYIERIDSSNSLVKSTTDIIAFNLPKLAKTSWGIKRARPFRVLCIVGEQKKSTDWKEYAEKIEWIEQMILYVENVQTEDQIFMLIYTQLESTLRHYFL